MSRFHTSALWQSVAVMTAAALPAQVTIAATYLTTEKAQRALFPEAEAFDALALAPSSEQQQAVLKLAGPQAAHGNLLAWRARHGGSTVGYVFIDEVVGRQDFITYAVGIDAAGKLRPVEILEYRESHGGEIRNRRWLAQFNGRSAQGELRFRTDIKNIAGATLSSEHVTAGVRRILALWETLLKPAAGGST
ncbi:MAG TPA: FMN-binding protein [Steroidobacteraceae bacterium]|nr:FMN-binding protein [Steroidobacteraceae bacterium]